MNEDHLLAIGLARMEISLPEQVRETLLRFLHELGRWNRRLNLTAITDPEEAVEKHLLDSLTLLPILRGGERLLDMGSGAGFPGIPLKIVLPGLRVCSVDAVAKKVDFQRHIIRLLGLAGFEPRHGRAEVLGEKEEFSKAFDVVVSRAFSSLTAFAKLALPWLAPNGRIVAMKGAEGESELEAAGEELEQMGLRCLDARRLQLPFSRAKRMLIVLAKGEEYPLGPNI
jgi:16S rRNA (guanine527-N7)-methyltransferase